MNGPDMCPLHVKQPLHPHGKGYNATAHTCPARYPRHSAKWRRRPCPRHSLLKVLQCTCVLPEVIFSHLFRWCPSIGSSCSGLVYWWGVWCSVPRAQRLVFGVRCWAPGPMRPVKRSSQSASGAIASRLRQPVNASAVFPFRNM